MIFTLPHEMIVDPERRQRHWLHQELSLDPDVRVMIPILRAQTAAPLLDLADALVYWHRGEGLVLGLVEIQARPGIDLRIATSERYRSLLQWISANDYRRQPRPRTRLNVQVRVTHRVSWAIREAVYENNSNLMVIEWPGLSNRRRHSLSAVIDDLAGDPPVDLVLMRPDPALESSELDASQVLVAVRSGPNAMLALRAGVALAAAHGGRLVVLHVYDSRAHASQQAQERADFREIVDPLSYQDVEVLERSSENPGLTIREEAHLHPVVVLGAQASRMGSPMLVTAQMAGIVRQLPRTVILTKSLDRR
jgi:nucleotide-binding universal stress UspA family protein